MTRAEQEYLKWRGYLRLVSPQEAYHAGFKKALELADAGFREAHDDYLEKHPNEDERHLLIHAGDAGLEAIRNLDK